MRSCTARSENPLKFLCYLVIALAASRLKVNLPGISRDDVGELSVPAVGGAGTELVGSHGAGLRRGCGAVPGRSSDPASGRLQRLLDRPGHRGDVRRLSLLLVALSDGESHYIAVSGDVRLLRGQHGSAGLGHLADRAPVATKDLVRLLLLELPLLPGGCGRGRHDELAARIHRLADVVADASGDVPHLPFLPSLLWQTGRREAARGRDRRLAHAHDRGPCARHRGQGPDHARPFTESSSLRRRGGEGTQD